MKEKKYLVYQGVFEGAITKRLQIQKKNIADLIEIFKQKSFKEDGILKINQKNLITGKITQIKTISIFNHLFLTKEESI